MSIERLFDKSATIYRLSSGTYTQVYSGVNCRVETWSQGDRLVDGTEMQGFLLWCGFSVDILEGDRVLVDSIYYFVYKIEKRSYGFNKHILAWINKAS